MMAYNAKNRKPYTAISTKPDASPETSIKSFGMVQAEFDDHENWSKSVIETIKTTGSY